MAIPNTNVALRLAPILTICVMVIGGFYVPLDLISPFLAWASWLSMARYVPFCCNECVFSRTQIVEALMNRYGFSAFVVNEFGGRLIACDESVETANTDCPLPGSAVIASYGIKGVWTSVWMNVAMLVLIQVLLRISTYILLRIRR